MATDWEGELALCRRAIRENLLTRIASNKTQVNVVHLRQLGVCRLASSLSQCEPGQLPSGLNAAPVHEGPHRGPSKLDSLHSDRLLTLSSSRSARIAAKAEKFTSGMTALHRPVASKSGPPKRVSAEKEGQEPAALRAVGLFAASLRRARRAPPHDPPVTIVPSGTCGSMRIARGGQSAGAGDAGSGLLVRVGCRSERHMRGCRVGRQDGAIRNISAFNRDVSATPMAAERLACISGQAAVHNVVTGHW